MPDQGPPRALAFYYDPIIDHIQPGGPQFAAYVAFYLLPQVPAVARRLFDWASATYHWADPDIGIPPLRDRRVHALGLVLARELGDAVAEARLREYVERVYEPTWDDRAGEFTWGFGLGEPVPRGQLNGVVMMAEIGGQGSWAGIFNRPKLGKFGEPTVCGVQFPDLGITQAWFDGDANRLAVSTHAGPAGRRGAPSAFRVTSLPSPQRIAVTCDGEPFPRWRVSGPDEITLETTVDERHFLIHV